MTRLATAVFMLAVCAAAQHGTETRRNASDYPANAEAGGVSLGAEYLARSAGTGRGMIVIPEHIVVDAALYPAAGSTLEVSAGHFRLRVNGKQILLPQPAASAAAVLKYPDWSMQPGLEVAAGSGDRGVILRRRRPVERFPGDRRPGETRVPGTVSVDRAEDGEMPPEEMVTHAALPEGPTRGPVSGFLYFYYKGKLKKIKALELLYDTGERQAALKLR
ncbi:MAG: hypothetical protein ACM3ZB_12585 [bacterium]